MRSMLAFRRMSWRRNAGLTLDQIQRVWKDIEAKRRAPRYLHEPLLVDEAVRA